MKLDQSVVQSRLAFCAAALAGTAAASSANAAIISFTTPIIVPNAFSGTIPQTTAGVYINLGTGASATSGALSGWDFNPYSANGGTQLGFYWSQDGLGAAGVAGTATGPYLDLSGGGVVGPASTYSDAILGTTASPFLTVGTHILGFTFENEATAVENFGYMTIQNLGPNTTGGFASTITGWSYDNTGAAITVPPIPTPAAIVPLSMAALAFGARRVRPWRNQTAA